MQEAQRFSPQKKPPHLPTRRRRHDGLGANAFLHHRKPNRRLLRCDPNWSQNRQRLADCSIGFGQGTLGGKGGRFYLVTDSSDDDAANPIPGTLRHAVIQAEPLWIVFSGDMGIKLNAVSFLQLGHDVWLKPLDSGSCVRPGS
ncbi:hypothetical protein DY000_02034688 [Brassica cretica]|uniref:Uncharacterized protein n=1 Tax=Brassica cretica TaxID=69181 RepID=A0ABQ7DKM7_BRACR|nr:hypothetical protein DY000_02034688 [Brassica cretica]